MGPVYSVERREQGELKNSPWKRTVKELLEAVKI